ncbi:nucleotide-binding protein [Paraburkholderia tropica]|uniref:nucleotide-binding protein n=1 Tax=Paraburkholderia tropica TaxID=92647 RepID=UPI002AB650C5|nr:nucleotide-binding protein [Paraburkholderia tropica]
MQNNDYYNLIVSAEPGHWDKREGSTPKTRFHYCSEQIIKDRFFPMSDSVEARLMQLPAIFACETDPRAPTPAYVGHITKVQHRNDNYYLQFEPDPRVPPLNNAVLAQLHDALGINTKGFGDLGCTHWSVKNADLYGVLERQGLINRTPEPGSRPGAPARPDFAETFGALLASPPGMHLPNGPAASAAASSRPADATGTERPRVFIVHGHNVAVREEVARFVSSLGLEAVILHEQANQGRTILEKFQDEAARAAFAIVLLTGDDRGGVAAVDPARYQLRARQNVVFEFGFFAGRLGLPRVCALVDGHVEQPSDIHGLVYVSLGADWKIQLAREMKTAGIPIDPSKLLG